MSRGLRVADIIRKEFFITGRLDYPTLEDICFAKNAYVKSEKITGAQGRILFSANSEASVITISSDIKHETKRKFVLAHELGHRLLHYRKMNFVCTDRDLNEWRSNNKFEFEANQFASEILMPENLVLEITDSKIFSKTEIKKISDNLGSSITSSSIQYTKYGNIPTCVIVSSDGKIDWYSRSDDFYIRHFERGEKLPRGSLAGIYFRTGKKQNEPSVCLAKDWDLNQSSEKYFYEDCFYFDNYRSVITYLWLCTDY